MADLKELKDRILAAESGYPQLDLLIWNSLNKTGETWKWLNNVDGDERIICDKMAEGSIFRPVCSVDRFSRSIDSAVWLLEAKLPKCGWYVTSLPTARIWAMPTTEYEHYVDVTCCARTPPSPLLPLCLMRLRRQTSFPRRRKPNDQFGANKGSGCCAENQGSGGKMWISFAFGIQRRAVLEYKATSRKILGEGQ
jgi:hypothetical protein